MDNIFQLKDGRTCTIRECVEADAEPVLKLFRIAAAESDNLGRLPDEIRLTIEEEREYIRVRRDSPNSMMVLAEVDGRAVAIAGVAIVNASGRAKSGTSSAPASEQS